eukprot:GHVR01052553.1.p1 GENE.GHVR01052553.1~~GHVR01052553.1.p1  ORF type:complete len:103 (-),score=0.69 GHVR01052553.1:178-486(-)
MNYNLVDVLQGCLNQNTVHSSENELAVISKNNDFVEELLKLIPNQEHNLLVFILSTLKQYMLARYNNPENLIPVSQKNLLKDNVFNLFYVINHDNQAINLYK